MLADGGSARPSRLSCPARDNWCRRCDRYRTWTHDQVTVGNFGRPAEYLPAVASWLVGCVSADHIVMARPAWLVMARLPSLGCGPLRDELAGPAHPPGGRVGMVAELLCHPADAAADTELLHGTANCRGHHVSGRSVGRLQPRGEQGHAAR